MATKARPIYVIKKKGGHAGHHGGAWKVAYADFVTALMSLFIVLWLMNQSEQVKKAVAGYFNDPKGTGKLMGTMMTGTGEGQSTTVSSAKDMKDLKEKIEKEVQARPELQKLSKQIEISETSEGLRIELLEDKNGTFYQSGSPHLSDNGQKLLALLAAELKTLPNRLLIEGHTDAAQYSTDTNYSNWELSADRANAARRLMQQDGVRSDQVTQVRGYADQFLRVKNNPYDPSNRRITILVKNGGDGATTQLPGAHAVDGGAKAAGAEAPNAASSPKTSAPPVTAAKPAAAPAAKPGIVGKLAAMMPGKKK